MKISLPLTWTALTDPQLHYLCTLISSAHYTPDEIRAHLIIRLARLTPYALRHIHPLAIATHFDHLQWIEQPPTYPVRYATLDNHPALRPDLHQAPFTTYLQVENYYQAYLQSPDTNAPALQAIATHLYPGFTRKQLQPDEQYMLLLWLVGLKTHYAHLFPHLFRQSTDPDQEPPDPREVMNAEIRALTQGDITKTTAVLQTDTLTALTELDAKAAEAQELQKLTK